MLPHIFVHSLIAVHCLLLRLPSCDLPHIYYHWVSHTKQIVDTCVLYTTFKLFITYRPEPFLASYPLLNYALRGLRRSACGRKPLTHLPIY